ncbi:hypothetical protein VB714_21575 [Spirulina sp. 06S082]|nr:hypothetical protein [Spirulina sp. 06S082]
MRTITQKQRSLLVFYVIKARRNGDRSLQKRRSRLQNLVMNIIRLATTKP